ncbi:MAG TPA: DUF6644 family protein [Burkholderiales bacterium]|nr:DUF6644 family protein [Burkholderiales bacterium]
MTPESPIERLQEIGIAAAMRDSLWLYPFVEILHILGFVVLVGSVVMFDLRLLGVSSRIPVRMLAGHLLPWSLGSLIVVLPAGLLLFLTDAAAIISNPAFTLKILLLFVVAGNALAFHLGPFRTVVTWDVHTPAPHAARFHATLSLLLWISIIACGRSIAYV